MNLNYLPMDHQKEGIEFAIRKYYSLNAYEMGLGKTFVALALAVKKDLNCILIVSPAFLIPNWKSEVEKFTSEKCESNLNKKSKFYIISYNSIHNALDSKLNFEYIICDEVHYAKNMKAKRTRYLHMLVEKIKPRYFLGLSGTSIKNRIPELYSLLKLCYYGNRYLQFSDFSSSIWKFNKTFCNEVISFAYGRKITNWEGVKNTKRLKELLTPIYIRKRAKEVLKLPDEISQDLLMANKIDVKLKQAFEDYKGKKDSSAISTVKAISALSKIKYTVDFVKDRINEAGKFIVFTDHIQSAESLHSAFTSFDLDTKLITGSTPSETRHQFVNDINEGDVQILVATIGALSVGVNLTGVSHMVFNDYPWVGADISQAKKRIHRIGQKFTCYYYFILTSEVDKMILRTLRKKQKVIEAIEI